MMSASTSAVGDRSPQPKLMSSFRRFGKYDRFQPIGSSTSSIGSKSFGRITIDCQLLFNKSQWGTLEGLPGGIMYLNLNFGPPQGSRLREATITITLDEQDTRLEACSRSPPLRTLHQSGAAVQVTEWYGPQTLGGTKKSANITSTTKAIPQASILGYSVGGVGHEQSKKFMKESRWSFNGQLLRGKRTSTYTTLKWHLTENELDGQSFHNPKVHTAFSFEHSGQPFLMKVEIKGRLQKWHEQLQSNLKFGVDGAREGRVITLVDFEDYQRFSRSLDGLARGLPRAMEMENLQDIPIEVPDSVPGASFQQVQPPQFLLQNYASHPQALGPNEKQPVRRRLGQTESLSEEPENVSQRHGAFPTAEDYKCVLSLLSLPRPRGLEHENRKVSSLTSASTLFDGENATVTANGVHNSTKIDTPKTEAEESRRNAALLILNVGGNSVLNVLWCGLMQFLANILTLLDCGSLSKTTTEVRGKNVESEQCPYNTIEGSKSQVTL